MKIRGLLYRKHYLFFYLVLLLLFFTTNELRFQNYKDTVLYSLAWIQIACVLVAFVFSVWSYYKGIYYIDNLFWIVVLIYLLFRNSSIYYNLEIHRFGYLYLGLVAINLIKFRSIFLPISIATFIVKFLFMLNIFSVLLDSRYWFYAELKIGFYVYVLYTFITIIITKREIST